MQHGSGVIISKEAKRKLDYMTNWCESDSDTVVRLMIELDKLRVILPGLDDILRARAIFCKPLRDP